MKTFIFISNFLVIFNLFAFSESMLDNDYHCNDIENLVNNQIFNINIHEQLYLKCPKNEIIEIAFLISKGDKYEEENNPKLAYENYQLGLIKIEKNNIKLFEEYKFYLNKKINNYQNTKIHISSKIDNKEILINSENLENYIAPRSNATRDANLEKFSIIKGIPLNFESGSFKIKNGVNLAQAQEIGKFLSKPDYINRVIYITGYTDTQGNYQNNQILSFKRANELKNYLILHFNLKSEYLKAEGYGEIMPICNFGEKQKNLGEYSCSGEENYTKSRRVTLEYGE